MNYTKGEWKHEGDGIITTKDGQQISSVFPRDRLANANLISAAPMMYEALKELVASEKHRTTFRAEQALAKAEGVN